jgi:type 1 glutamine amidotransferase
VLRRNGFEVSLTDSLAPLADPVAADELDLVVPVWSIAEAPDEEVDAFCALVASGAGVAAFHGAIANFRRHYGWQRVLGGQFVWHPEPHNYTVELADGSSFALHSEQYYVHVDPANEVLATTTFEDGAVVPVAWRRTWGTGRSSTPASATTPRRCVFPRRRRCGSRARSGRRGARLLPWPTRSST